MSKKQNLCTRRPLSSHDEEESKAIVGFFSVAIMIIISFHCSVNNLLVKTKEGVGC